jgi:hypothetical protein
MNELRLRRIAAMAAFALAGHCGAASAASMQATVQSLFQLSGKVYIGLTNVAWDGAPTTCTPSTPTYAVDPGTAVGRAQLAMLVTAKEAGHRVYLVGDGTCTGGGPNGMLAESLVGIQLQ